MCDSLQLFLLKWQQWLLHSHSDCRSAPKRLRLLKAHNVTGICCHTSQRFTLWTVTDISLRLSLDTFICQAEIINTIISPTSSLYSVNFFQMWLCLFISDAWISERSLICLFHYTAELNTACQDMRLQGLGHWCPICKAMPPHPCWNKLHISKTFFLHF